MIVSSVRVVTANFLVDSWETLKNLFGLRQKEYEEMIKVGIDEATKELVQKYPCVKNVKIEITEVKNASIMVCAYGEI
jgi:uncharacterized protein YbjQ (UPF0145 family)